jgi:hypothetical protein
MNGGAGGCPRHWNGAATARGPLQSWAKLCWRWAIRLIGPIARGQETRADRLAHLQHHNVASSAVQGLDASTGRRGTLRSVFPWSGRRDLLDGRGQGHSHRLEDLATRALSLAPQQEPLPVLLHLHHLQTIQVLDHIGPLELVAPLLQPGLEFLTQHQRQERAEDMTSDRLVTPVGDRTGL